MRDDEVTGVRAHSIVDVDREVSHLARQIKVLREGHLHSGRLRTDEAHLLLEGNDDIELRVVHDGAHRADMYSLTITQLALTVLIVEEIRLHRHNLGLEEVAELDSELGPPLHEVERLGKIGWDLELERNRGISHLADVVGEDGNHLCFLPDATLPYVRVSLAFVTVVDLLTHVNQLELQLDAVGWNCTVCVNVNISTNWMIGIEGPLISLELDPEGSSIHS